MAQSHGISMKHSNPSRPVNFITKNQLKLVLGGNQDFSKLSFWPAANSGEYFTLGCVEVFVLE